MNNLTKTIAESALPGMVFNFGLYFTIGFLSFVANLLLFAAIYRHEMLRSKKEWIVLSTVVFMDMVQGLAFAIAGATRIWYIEKGVANELVTRLGCLLKPWNLLWFPFTQCYGSTLLMLSVDRLLSVSIPIPYMIYGNMYALLMIGLFHAPYIPTMIYIAYKSFTAVDSDIAYISQICYTSWIYKDQGDNKQLIWHGRACFSTANKAIRGYMAWASVFLYVGVVVQYHLRMKRVLAALTERKQRERMEAERGLVITLGLSAIATLVFFVSPSLVFSTLGASSEVISTVSPFKALNYLVNPLLFYARHNIVRKAVSCLFTNQKLTPEMMMKSKNVVSPVGPATTTKPRTET